MESYDSPRDYRMALGTRRGSVPSRSGSAGMSPVLVSPRLMIALDASRANRWQEPSDDQSTTHGFRADDAAAAA